MSFSGDLEHLPIVDVIQLIHSTQKSGTLKVKSPRGECQLVFDRGYIISANHANNNVRIGQVLVELGFITREEIDRTLEEQKSAGADRLPLIAALIENGLIKKEQAHQGLEALIHLTIVQILSWGKGTFTLEVEDIEVGDNYRYFPEQLHEDFLLSAQGVLMDALRIYDEKMRDGELENGIWDDDTAPAAESGDGIELSEELLGLDELDQLEDKIPQVFSGLRDQPPLDIQREKLAELLPDLDEAGQEQLSEFLSSFDGAAPDPAAAESGGALVLYTGDGFFQHAAMTILKPQGYQVFATGDRDDLNFMTGQHLSKGIVPLVIFDAPQLCGAGDEAALTDLRHELAANHPSAALVQLATPDAAAFTCGAYRDGVRAVFPRPGGYADSHAARTFLEGFRDFTIHYFQRQSMQPFALYQRHCEAMSTLSQPPELSAALLKIVAEMFERALTLIVTKNELVSERGIGIDAPREEGPVKGKKIVLPLTTKSIFSAAVGSGATFYAESNDALLRDKLFAAVGTPRTERILLLPFKSRGRVIALTYADFGDRPPTAARIDLLEALAARAGLNLDEALYRKQLEKPGQ